MLDFIFGKFGTRRPAWNVLLGWQVMTYEEGDRWFSLQVEPMFRGPCKVYVPDAALWTKDVPAWAAERRDEILGRLRSKAWNRDLVWEEGPKCTTWPHHVDAPWERGLEATKGGRQLLSMRLFDVDNPMRMSREDAKKAWCTAAEAMCMQIDGNVDLIGAEIIPGSVFQEVVIPALKRNPRAQVTIA